MEKLAEKFKFLFENFQADNDNSSEGLWKNGSRFNFNLNNLSDTLRELQAKNVDPFKKILDFLNLYLTPLIIIVGIIGNTACFLVFSLTHLRRLSSSIYLCTLALADTGFLLTLFIVWLDRIEIGIFRTNGVCQGVVYLTHVFYFLSVWNVVSFTAERYIVVFHPLRRDVFCTRKKSKIVVITLSVIAVITYNFAAWTSGVVQFSQTYVCMPLPQYYDLLTVLTSVDTFVCCLVPSALIIVLNMRMIVRIHQYQKTRMERDKPQKLGSQTVTAVANFRRHARSALETSVSSDGSIHIKFSARNNINIARQNDVSASSVRNDRILKNRSQFRTARMLLILSSVFVLLNLPSHAFRVRTFFKHTVFADTKSSRKTIRWEELFQLVYFLNFSINFFIYSACGRQFRRALKQLLLKFRYRREKCYFCHDVD